MKIFSCLQLKKKFYIACACFCNGPAYVTFSSSSQNGASLLINFHLTLLIYCFSFLEFLLSFRFGIAFSFLNKLHFEKH